MIQGYFGLRPLTRDVWSTLKFRIKANKQELLMRILLRAVIPAEAGNHGLQSGKWQRVTTDFMKEFNPECMYFVIENGFRNIYVVANIDKVTDIPALSEPWFQGLNAEVEVMPALTFDEMDEAGPAIAMAIGNYAERYIHKSEDE